MSNLTNLDIAQCFGDWLNLNNPNTPGIGLSQTLTNITDGLGNLTPVQLATNAINFNTVSGNSLQINNVALTASATLLNSITNSMPDFSFSTSAMVLPKGTTVQRPSSPTPGSIRWNDTLGMWEGWTGAAWVIFQTS